MSATAAIAEFGIRTSATCFPEEVIKNARRAIIDTIGVTIAGSLEPASRIAMEYARSRGNSPESSIWAGGVWASAHEAALANGIASHVLDFDDTNDSMRGHPSVSILPAVYAVGDQLEVSGADVLTAFLVGAEVACKLGRFTGQEPYDRGWHVTATNGVIGATVGVSRLAGLSIEETQHAIGIAVSFASGVRANFGSMTKSLHVGHVAQSAITAVELARRGLTASTSAIEAPFGYWTVFGRDPEHAKDDLGSVLGAPYDIISPGLNVKAYPCCASTHAAIDAALSLREDVSADDIESVCVAVPYTAPLILIHHRPSDPLSAKFSLEYCVAAALADGAVTLDHFTDESVQRPDLQALLRRVSYVVPPEWERNDGVNRTGMARIDVYVGGGTIRHAETTTVRGSPSRPLSSNEHDAKFMSCAGLVYDADKAHRILQMLLRLDQLPTIRPLSALLVESPNRDRTGDSAAPLSAS